jgi:gamma-glutamylcyclotransferase (GGCT)/AIG2-like uncharacterized protein YtfP
VTDAVFFYGTLMAGFDRPGRLRIDPMLRYLGRGSIQGALFDLGIYPAAVPATDSRVWGEVYETDDIDQVLAALDEIEGNLPNDPDHSLYQREKVSVSLPGGRVVDAWVYFYNAPLGQAPRIDSGDYLAYVTGR